MIAIPFLENSQWEYETYQKEVFILILHQILVTNSQGIV